MSFLAKNQTNPLILDATGYTPYSLARIKRAEERKDKNSKTFKRDTAIRDYWIQQNRLEEIENYANQHAKDLFRSQWEFKADKKGLYSRVKWEMDKIYAKQKEDLEVRRKRLKELLEKENEIYAQEINAKKTNPEQETTHLVEKYKAIQEAKEEKRQKIVKNKREQQFRVNKNAFLTWKLSGKKLRRKKNKSNTKKIWINV